MTSATVADRVKIVEERKDGTGYSTKINLNLTDTPFVWKSGKLFNDFNDDLDDLFYTVICK